ncbi:unnamed protein product [Urochloa humidicola]
MLLVGSLGFVNPLKDALRTYPAGGAYFWLCFATVWGLLSVGFHMSLAGQINRLERAYIQFIAHLSLVLFCGLVIFYLYLNTPIETLSTIWFIESACILMGIHITVWYGVVKSHKVSREDASIPRRSHVDIKAEAGAANNGAVDIEAGVANNGANGGNDDSAYKKKE